MGYVEVGGKSSGRIVYLVRELAVDYCRKHDCEYIVIDSATGIGCTVISSIVNTNAVIIVVEPTLSSLQGICRIVETTKKLKIENVYAVINKVGIGLDIDEVKKFIETKLEIDVVGLIEYSSSVVKSYTNLMTMFEYEPNSKICEQLRTTFKNLLKLI